MIEQLRKKGFVTGTLVLPTNLHIRYVLAPTSNAKLTEVSTGKAESEPEIDSSLRWC